MKVLSRQWIISKQRVLQALVGLLAVWSILPVWGVSQSPVAASKPSLFLITIDTLRADYVSALHVESPVKTPWIDALIADGVSFTQAQTTNPLTTPAHASMLTGLWPLTHGVRDFTGNVLGDEHVTLGEILRSAGYTTAGFVSAAVLDHRTGLAQGMDTFEDGFQSFLGSDTRVAERAGSETIRLAERWLESQGGNPVFVWIHLYEPHDPYRPPEPFRTNFPGNSYAGEVAYVDSLLGGFLERLRTLGRYSDATVALLSDHGEGLGEHGESKHGFFAYQTTMHVPWILKFPGGQFAGQRVPSPVSVVDLLPTLLHVLEIDRSLWPDNLQGESRLRLLRQQATSASDIYMESMSPRYQHGWSDLRVIRRGRHKLIEAPRPELYDLSLDPGETNNLFPSNQALGRSLQEALKSFESRFESRDAPNTKMDPELEERLRSLGYVGVQSSVRRDSSREGLADPKDKIEVFSQMERGVEAAREKRWGVALAELTRAAEAEPSSPAIATSLAMALADSGRSNEAIRWFQRVLELEPTDQAIRLRLARLQLQAGQLEQAQRELEVIVEADPSNFLALFNLGTLAGQQRKFEVAADYFSRALQVRSDLGAVRSLAMAQGFSGKLDAARETLEKGIQQFPNDASLHQLLADIYRQLGNEAKAAEHLSRARSLRPPGSGSGVR